MKIVISLILFYGGQLMAQSSLYNISISAMNGKTINMADYKGKKILVAAVSPDNLQNGQLRWLDSLQLSNPSITIIVVPATDFQGANDSAEIASVRQNVSLHITAGAADGVKKANAIAQNRLFRWLTNSSENTHFDADVQTDDQIYVISESGVLYAVLGKGVPISVINQILQQDDVKQ